MSRQERRIALALCRRLLDGVGDPEERIETSERVIHVKRPIASAEVPYLPTGFCELEAVDGAGEPGLLDAIARHL